MNTQHTPTPWRVTESSEVITDEFSNYLSGIVIESTDGLTNIVDPCGGIPLHEVQANTEFIIRAVNSHDALIEIARYISRPGTHIESEKCLHCKAEKAITLAEGGTL